MSSLSVTLDAIENALLAKYAGIQIDIEGTPTDVAVFLEDPNTEETPERVYPSVSIMLVSALTNLGVSEGEEGNEEQTDYDTGVTPHETVMRETAEPARVMYSIDTWVKYRGLHDRELMQEVYFKRTKKRGYITAQNVDSEAIDLDVFWFGSIVSNDEIHPDMVIYHKTLTLEVLAHISQTDITRRQKVVMEQRWDVFNRKTLTTVDGVSIVVGGDEKDLTMAFDDTTEGPI